jgi:methyltransferase family protein
VADESCDFVYIDADHSFDAVTVDLRTWYPKLKVGGVMSGHDYFDARANSNLEPIRDCTPIKIPTDDLTSYGVKSAVDLFISDFNVNLFVTPERLPTWYFIKPTTGSVQR